MMLKAARATCDFYIENTPTDGIPYWDTGAPELASPGRLPRPAGGGHNDFEPVDSCAAAIAAQGLLRLGHYLQGQGQTTAGDRYFQAGLTVLDTLFDEPYLSTDRGSSGFDPALDLPPAQRLGPHSRGRENSLGRIEHVGRLPCPRSRALRAAPGRRTSLTTLSSVRPLTHDHRRPRANPRPPLSRRAASPKGWSATRSRSRRRISPSATSRSIRTAARCPGTTRSRRKPISSSKAPPKCVWAKSARRSPAARWFTSRRASFIN